MFTYKQQRCSAILGAITLAAAALAPTTPALATANPNQIIEAFVPASTGGTFSDDPIQPTITLTIPAGALSADARLTVKRKDNSAPAGENQTAASQAYDIKLREASGADDDADAEDGLTLSHPMTMAIVANPAPVHPQLGEIAVRTDDRWQRMRANFYRASDSTVVTMTRRTAGKFRVMHRALQARSGPDVERGRDLYFNETWGDEAFWGDLFGLHHVLNNVTPVQAVQIGAQVDITKVPQFIVDVMLSDDFETKQAALNDPAVARALMKADAVIGVRGVYDDPDYPDMMTSVGLTCALCHVTVTPTEFQLEEGADPVPLPIGPTVLGPPNTRLDPGLLLSFTPLVQSGSEAPKIDQYTGWGPGRVDPRFFPGNPFDDEVFNPSSIPPHWNFVDLNEQGYTYTWIGVLQGGPDNNSLASAPECGIDLVLGVNGAWGTENASVKNIEIANDLPQEYWDRLVVAEQVEPGNDIAEQDMLDLEAFMQSIVSPAPGEFDEAAAEAGWKLFYGKANCVACHETAEGTGDAGFFTNIVTSPPQGLLSIGIKIPGLRGLAYTAPYFHDGSAATLADVVERYTSPDIPQVPDLDADEQAALMEYLKSL